MYQKQKYLVICVIIVIGDNSIGNVSVKFKDTKVIFCLFKVLLCPVMLCRSAECQVQCLQSEQQAGSRLDPEDR